MKAHGKARSWKMSGGGFKVLCVVKAKCADEAFAKARLLFGNIITGCQLWDMDSDSILNHDWLVIE